MGHVLGESRPYTAQTVKVTKSGYFTTCSCSTRTVSVIKHVLGSNVSAL